MFSTACARIVEEYPDLIKVARGIFSIRQAQTAPHERQHKEFLATWS
jgi:hypothetical protein